MNSRTVKPTRQSLWSRFLHLFIGGERRQPRKIVTTSNVARLAALCGSVVAASGACAQNAATASPSSASGPVLQEVVVTAEKRTESALNAPVALTVISGQDLVSSNIVSASDLGDHVPGLEVQHNQYGINLTLRGITTQSTTTYAPGVDYIVDGVSIYNPYEQALAYFDVNSVQILRGPQGTLYGAGSPGGVVLVSSNLPQDGFHAEAHVEVGNYNTRREFGMLNYSVTDWLNVRLALNANDRSGFLAIAQNLKDPTLTQAGQPLVNGGNEAHNAEHDAAGKLSALIKFSPENTLLLRYQQGEINGPPYGTTDFHNVIDFSAGVDQRVANFSPVPANLDQRDYAESAVFNGKVGPVSIFYSGAYDHFTMNDIASDEGGVHGLDPGQPGFPSGNFSACILDSASPNGVTCPGDPTDVNNRTTLPPVFLWGYRFDYTNTLQQELRFSNANSGPFDWLVGLSAIHEVQHIEEPQFLLPSSNPLGTDVPVNGVTPPISFSGIEGSYLGSSNAGNTYFTSAAVFGNVHWQITDAFGLTVGVRESRDKVDTWNYARNGVNTAGCFEDNWLSGCTPNPVTGLTSSPTLTTGSSQFNKFTYRVGMDYHPTRNQMLYATVSTGYKPGGFNNERNEFNVPVTVPYGPESLTAYEVGYKALLARRLRLSSDVYYYNYSQQQVQAAIQFGGGATQSGNGGNFNFQNVMFTTPVKYFGWESTADFALTDEDQVRLGINLAKSYYVNLTTQCANNTCTTPLYSWAGTAVTLDPAFQARIDYTHEFPLSDGASIAAHVGSIFSSDYNVDSITTAIIYKQRPFHRTDADLTYTTADGRFYGTAYVQNIENSVQMTFFQGGGCFGCGSVGITDPETFGLRLGVKY